MRQHNQGQFRKSQNRIFRIERFQKPRFTGNTDSAYETAPTQEKQSALLLLGMESKLTEELKHFVVRFMQKKRSTVINCRGDIFKSQLQVSN